MGLRDRVYETLGLVSADDFDRRVGRAYEAGFYDAGNDDPPTSTFKKGGQGYKRLSDKYVRETGIDFQRAIKTAWQLWQKSPIAKRTLALKRDHLIGHSAEPTTNDQDLAEILDEFWRGNKLDKRASEFTMQLFGFGEQCYPAFVREADGRTRLGYIDPQSIETVVKHPDNSMEDWAIVAQKSNRGGYTTEKLVYRIIREAEDFSDGDEVVAAEYAGKLVTHTQTPLEPWEETMLAEYDRSEYDGSCFYTKVNAVSNQSRGMSDLLQVGDWIDQADDVLFSLADREQFAGYFSFDVTLAGASDEQVRQRAKELRASPPDKGSVNVHNDAETWQMFAPDLKQGGSIETFRAVLGLILGGMGFPVHWFGFGDDANRATAVSQSDPTAKSLEHDQGVVRDMLLYMCRFASDQAEIAGLYTPSEDEDNAIALQLPEVTTRDLTRITASMQALTISLVNGVDAGWITQDTAAEAFAKLLGEMDIQVDPAEELEQVEMDTLDSELEIAARQNGQLQRQLATNGEDSGEPEE